MREKINGLTADCVDVANSKWEALGGFLIELWSIVNTTVCACSVVP